MALKYCDYQKLLNLTDYQNVILSAPGKAECATIYTTVSAIDFNHYVDECNRLSSVSRPSSSTVSDFDTLLSEIDTDLGMVKGLITSATNKQAATPAIVVRGELSNLRCQVKSQREKANKASKHPTLSSINSVVTTTKNGLNKVIAAHRKIGKPATDLYDSVEKSMEDGGSNFYSSFMRRK